MRKFQLLTLAMLLAISLFGQAKYGTEYLSESFSSGVPPTDWTIENYTTQWTAGSSANAGGTAPELKFTYINGSLTTRFISPVVDLTDVSLLKLSFKQLVDHYGAGYSIGVATRSNGGAWNTVWTVSPSGNIGPETRTIDITNADLGSSTFQFCFFLTGNAYQIDYWFIDDVILYTPFQTDLMIKSIDVSKYTSPGMKDVKVSVQNVGVNQITSFDAYYTIDGGTPVAQAFTGLTLNPGQSIVKTFSQQWDVATGTYSIEVLANNINLTGDDDDMSNNTLSKPIHIASQTVTNLPLFEEFTSSTCAPCASFNSSVFTPFMNTYAGQYAIVKYQMSWPAPGDPYYTAEGGVRRAYYGVSGVPTLETGGKVTSTTSPAVTTAFNDEKNKLTFFDINATSNVTGTTVTANIEVLPYITVNNFKLHAAIVEKITTGNVASNGETSFKYVMMKMLPDANGTTVSFTDGTPYLVEFTQDLSATNIEEYNDLALIVFIQNDETKEVFQSLMINSPLITSVETNSFGLTSIYPNPTNGNFSINMPTVSGKVAVNIYSVTGSLVESKQFEVGNGKIDMNISQPKGVYYVTLTLDGGTSQTLKLVVK